MKEKLTLSVDREIVEKAKKLGINISDITEKVLKGYTSAEEPSGNIYDAYQQLFDAIIPLLKEFGGSVKVAKGIFEADLEPNGTSEIDYDILLEADGSFSTDPDIFTGFRDIKKIDRSTDRRDFLSPEKILSDLVDTLAKSKEKNEERMRQILTAKRIVDAMTETLIGKPPSTR